MDSFVLEMILGVLIFALVVGLVVYAARTVIEHPVKLRDKSRPDRRRSVRETPDRRVQSI